MAGARGVLIERFSARGALELIEKERVTYIADRARLDRRHAQRSGSRHSSTLGSLRVVITGGASAADRDASRRFPGRAMHGHLIELYGMLETGFHTYTRFTDDPLQGQRHHRPRASTRWSLRIIDDDGNDVPHGEIGEIAALGPSVHLGYHDNPTANADSVHRPTAGFAPATSAASPMPQGNVRIAGRRRRSSTAAARSFSRARSRRSSTRTRRSARRDGRRRPIRGSARTTACA